jgi:hypothetical protein
VNPYDPYPVVPSPYPESGIDFDHLKHLLVVGAVWLVAAAGIVSLR